MMMPLSKRKEKKGDYATESGFSWRVVLFYTGSSSSAKEKREENNKQEQFRNSCQKLLNLNGENDDNSRYNFDVRYDILEKMTNIYDIYLSSFQIFNNNDIDTTILYLTMRHINLTNQNCFSKAR
jgi:hypothetical protein